MKRNNPIVKPFLKWAGGKRQLLPEIMKYTPSKINSYTYYEPFVGAGALLFALQPKKAVINDFNIQLMSTYRVIRDNIDDLIFELKKHEENNEKNGKNYFYQIRSWDRDTDLFKKLSDVEKAGRLIFMNKTCYNGLYRVNSQGLFNAPYGSYKHPAICQEPVLRAVSKYLNNNDITILTGDFTEAVKTADKHSFVYFDPPYYSPDNTNFTGYQAGGFGRNEQIRLRDTFAKLTTRGVRCLLSNSDTEFIKEIYSEYKTTTTIVPAKRAINSDSAGRGTVNELLIRNWK